MPSICIVGAGPAGLSAAQNLKDLGHQDVTVYEASNRVGGKCCSIPYDGEFHDLGAIYAGSGYENVLRFARRFGVPIMRGPRHFISDSKPSTPVPLGFEAINWTNPKTLKAVLKFLSIVRKNSYLMRPGIFPSDPDLYLTINEYFEKHELLSIKDLFWPLMSGYGYGYAANVPVVYFFKLFYTVFPRNLSPLIQWFQVKANLKEAIHPDVLFWPVMFKGGYQAIFNKMAESLNVKLNTVIQSVDRREDGVYVTSSNVTERFDKIIFATDPSVMRQITALSEAENRLFSSVRFVRYFSILCRVKNSLRRGAVFYRDQVYPDKAGRLLMLSRIDSPSNVCVAYMIGDEKTGLDVAAKNLEKDLKTNGMELESIVTSREWKYFPHVPSEEIGSFYSTINEVQNRKNSFITGEIMNFSTVEGVCQYSSWLTNRYFQVKAS